MEEFPQVFSRLDLSSTRRAIGPVQLEDSARHISRLPRDQTIERRDS